jgi:DNA polymerase-1
LVSRLKHCSTCFRGFPNVFSCFLLKEKGLVNIAKVEFECISAVAEMEYNGIKIDLEKWNKLKEIYTEKKEETRKEVFTELEGKISPDMFGEIRVNIDSQAQVLKMLNSMKINVPNTNFNTLARLRSIPIIDKLINYRKVSKAVTSFLEPIPNLMQN